VDQVEVVVAHHERATLRVGDVFLKVDPDDERIEREVAAMALAPVPTPPVLWRRSPVLAIGAVRGRALGVLDAPSPASAAAWRAAGAAVRALHDAPLPPWEGHGVDARAARLERECEWLLANDVLPAAVIARNRELAESVLRPWTPAFVHGDLQIVHVFVDDDDEVSGIIDWSEAAPGDPLFDLASLTLAHEEHLDDVLAGYGQEVDRDLVRGWWAWRSLVVVQWLVSAGYGAPESFPEVAVLLANAG